MTPQRRRSALRIALITTAAASGVALICAVVAASSPWFVVIGTGACAVATAGAFYGAFEGFDERLRRRP